MDLRTYTSNPYTVRKIVVDDVPTLAEDTTPDYIEELPEYAKEDSNDNTDDGWFPSEEEIANWKKYFPMPNFRPHQEQAIDAILRGWASGKKYALVEGPTGSGKSPIAITLGSLFKNTFLCTPQKMLQNQYMKDFNSLLFELKGRATYPCLRINFQHWVEKSNDDDDDDDSDLSILKKRLKLKNVKPRFPEKGADYISLAEWNALDREHPWRKYNCAKAPCISRPELKLECKFHGVCEYITRRDFAFQQSPFSLFNFSNLLLFSLLMPQAFKRRPLLIMDECHTLESFLYDYATITLGFKQIEELKEFLTPDKYQQIAKPFEDMPSFIAYLENDLFPAFETYQVSRVIQGQEPIIPDDEDAEEEEEDATKDKFLQLKRLIGKLKDFIKEQPTEHSHILVPHKQTKGDKDEITGVQIKPFSVAPLAKKITFNSSNSRVLLMSATILNPKTFCKTVGIPEEECFFIRIPSTFPPSRRPIYGCLSVGSMSYKHKETTLPKMMLAIASLAEKHNNHKGIIHTGNYENMTYLQKWAKYEHPELYKRILFPAQKTFEEKEALLAIHEQSDKPLILCGPSFLEGLNLKDDLGRFNILMKMPYLSLADPLIKRKAEEFPEWYDLQVALAIIQAIGRTVRSETDWSIIYILDLLWKFFYENNKDTLFPPYIRQAIKWIHMKYEKGC